MAEDALIRLKNFKRLLTDRSLEVRELPETMGWGRYSFWKDLNDGNKSFGEKLARRIEEKLELPRGWLDTEGAYHAKASAPAPMVGEAEAKGPVDFRQRRVTESQWDTLQAVELLIPEAELQDLVRRYKKFAASIRDDLEHKQQVAAGKAPPAPSAGPAPIAFVAPGGSYRQVTSPLSHPKPKGTKPKKGEA